MPMLNDVQSRLNATEMLRVAHPSNVEEVRAAVNDSALRGEPVCPAGSLHFMGGQQFAGGGVSLSSSSLTAIGPLQRDPSGGSGIVQVQAGVTWPMLVRWWRDADSDGGPPLSIIQKQTWANVVYGTVRRRTKLSSGGPSVTSPALSSTCWWNTPPQVSTGDRRSSSR